MALQIRRTPAPSAAQPSERRLALVTIVALPGDDDQPSAIHRCARTGSIWRQGALGVQWQVKPPPGTEMVSLELLEGEGDLVEGDVLLALGRGAYPGS